ncbi:hypothetical protein [Nonomuraea sp. KM90]|uniref:hypothetical protein n=1 Tax=Nonomuraea sp. KM90 TaxID=3457428 RepID=UPI003FCC9A1D
MRPNARAGPELSLQVSGHHLCGVALVEQAAELVRLFGTKTDETGGAKADVDNITASDRSDVMGRIAGDGQQVLLCAAVEVEMVGRGESDSVGDSSAP